MWRFVENESEMLALSEASVGDRVLRKDNYHKYALAALPPSVLLNWTDNGSLGQTQIQILMTYFATHALPASATWGQIGGTLLDQLDLQLILDGKATSTHSHSPADITGTAIIGNDTRLADARTPTTHSHAESDVINLVTDLSGKAASSHSHATSEVTGLDTALSGKETANANIQAHVTAAHAPSNAQANADITKAEIEAKLTGEISSHSHAGSGGLGYIINLQALTSSPADSGVVYFGTLPKAPVTVAATSKVYIRKAGTIKIAEIYCYSGTAGTNQAWSLYIRKNNTTDTLIATLSVATNERVFTNSALAIAVAAGDYIEIKSIQPVWTTNPLTTIYGGYIYIE